jgi:hypothetical protein
LIQPECLIGGASLGGSMSDDELKNKDKKKWEKRQEIIGKLNALKGLDAETAKKMGSTSDQFAKIQNAVNAYGNPNDNNGVTLEVGKVDKGVGGTSWGKDASGKVSAFNVNFHNCKRGSHS